jgi:hypothetical protein
MELEGSKPEDHQLFFENVLLRFSPKEKSQKQSGAKEPSK